MQVNAATDQIGSGVNPIPARNGWENRTSLHWKIPRIKRLAGKTRLAPTIAPLQKPYGLQP